MLSLLESPYERTILDWFWRLFPRSTADFKARLMPLRGPFGRGQKLYQS